MSCKSKTYCPYPFIGASLQSDGTTLPCGQYMNVAPFNKFEPIEVSRNNSHMQEMRRKMLNNEHDSGCQCPAEEAAGIKSMRQYAVEQYGYQEFGKLKTVELFFDNVCNLKCRMCGSPRSHLWYEEEKQLYGTTLSPTKYIKNDLYKTIDIEKLEEIKLYGGEPLLSKEADEFFKNIIDNGNIEDLRIELITNGTVLPMPNVAAALLKCKYLRISISVDGYGELNNFIRSGSNWDEVVKTMNFFNSLITNRKNESLVSVHSAVGIYNANMMRELDEYVLATFPKFIRTKQMIQFPVFLSIQHASEQYKKIIEPYVDQETKDYMYSSTEDYFLHFINFHKKLNQIRNEDLKNNNPLLSNYIESYKDVGDSSNFFIQQIKFLQGYSSQST
jgi:sulfatase maturation enzyme AslB (radical SAM superfamily)